MVLQHNQERVPAWAGPFATVIATALALAALSLFSHEFSDAIYFIPIAVVSVSAVLFGLFSGLLATVISAAGIDFFVFPPLHEIGNSSEIDNIRLGVFIGISILVTSVGAYARAVRRRAEEAENRQRFLVEVSLLLSESLDYEITLDKITQLVVPDFADCCVIQLLGDTNKIESIKIACREAGKRGVLEHYIKTYSSDLDGPSPTAIAIRTGHSQIVSRLSDRWFREHSQEERQLQDMRRLAGSSFIIVPLRDHGRTFGAIGFGSFTERRRYGQDDLVFAEELGRRCSTALLNATLFQDTRRAIGARDDFISIASHELKTPLTSLYLHMRLLSRAYRKTSEQLSVDSSGAVLREMQKIERQADRLTLLVDQLLDLSRIRVGKLILEKGSTDLSHVTAEVVRQFREGEDAPKIEFSAPAPIFGDWDRERLEQVVLNLVSNAIKYGGPDPIHVRTEFDVNAGIAKLVVRDRGPGIPKEFQTKLFGRFERGPASGGSGLGLGLYIVRQIVEAHGGRVEVESDLGAGSTFTVFLPLNSNLTVAS